MVLNSDKRLRRIGRAVPLLLSAVLSVQLPLATIHVHRPDGTSLLGHSRPCTDPYCPRGLHQHARAFHFAFHDVCLACVWGGSANFTVSKPVSVWVQFATCYVRLVHPHVLAQARHVRLPLTRAPPARV